LLYSARCLPASSGNPSSITLRYGCLPGLLSVSGGEEHVATADVPSCSNNVLDLYIGYEWWYGCVGCTSREPLSIALFNALDMSLGLEGGCKHPLRHGVDLSGRR